VASRSVTVPPGLRLVPSLAEPVARGRASSSTRKRSVTTTVLLLLVPTALLVPIGIVMVFSASSVSAYRDYGSSFFFVQRQIVYSLAGLAVLTGGALLPYRAWRRLSVPLLGVTVLLLIVVLSPSAGTVAGGSARWIEIGPLTIQPSELAKFALIAFVATVLTRKQRHLDDLMHLALPLVPVVGLVAWLVMRQPDMGTTVLLAGTVFCMLFAAGVRLRHLGMVAGTGAVLGYALVMSETYRRERLLAFLHPWADAQNTGYHLIQGFIALGSGGLFGVGLGASRQKWGSVPNAHTDFIFAILGEELGLIAAMIVLVLFGCLIYAGLRVAARAPDTFGRLLATGIVAWIGLQTVVNLGAITGLLPITGVPLPLLSYGGSSLIVTLGAIGVLVNIARSSRTRSRPGPRPGPRAEGRAPASGSARR
jgi:cell division protein FtsW